MTFAFALFRAGKLPHELAVGAAVIFVLGVLYFFIRGTTEDK